MAFGCAVADRYAPKTVLLASSIGSALVTAMLAALVFTDMIQLWQLYVVAVLLGLIDALAYPAASAWVPRLVESAHLSGANAMISLLTQVATFLGPALAGLIIAAFSTGAAFAGSAVASLLAVFALRRIRPPVRQPEQAADTSTSIWRDMLADLRAGLRYTWQHPTLRAVIGVLAAVNLLLIGPIIVGGSLLAEQRFGGADAFGWLVSAWGAGGLLGALAGGMRLPRRAGGLLLAASALLAAGLIGLGAQLPLPLMLVTIGIMGCASGWMEVHAITWLQMQTAPALQGRVMGLAALAAVGMEPISYALTGALTTFGTATLFFAAGGTLLAITLLAALSRALWATRDQHATPGPAAAQPHLEEAP